jgi:hypothetical protein
VAQRRGIRGRATQGDHPDWKPLLDSVGEQVTGDFMWMYEVELDDGTHLQAYKHIDTRDYIHLAADGQAYYYKPPDRYIGVAASDVLAQVFRDLPRLGGVTAEQIDASWAAVRRLDAAASGADAQV